MDLEPAWNLQVSRREQLWNQNLLYEISFRPDFSGLDELETISPRRFNGMSTAVANPTISFPQVLAFGIHTQARTGSRTGEIQKAF